jgi:hypothetical protein
MKPMVRAVSTSMRQVAVRPGFSVSLMFISSQFLPEKSVPAGTAVFQVIGIQCRAST